MMVSLDTIKKDFRSFINKISRSKGKRLVQRELLSLSKQAEIFIDLLEDKGFVSEAGVLDRTRKDIVSKGIIEDRELKDLKKILNIL